MTGHWYTVLWREYPEDSYPWRRTEITNSGSRAAQIAEDLQAQFPFAEIRVVAA